MASTSKDYRSSFPPTFDVMDFIADSSVPPQSEVKPEANFCMWMPMV